MFAALLFVTSCRPISASSSTVSTEDALALQQNYPRWVSWDLTALTNQWLDGSAPNYGVILWATNEDTPGYELRFRSSLASVDLPVLEVVYTRPTKTVYFLKDHLGSIRATVDELGQVVGYDDYDPWGYILPGRSLATGTSTVAGAAKNKFTGKEWDDELGLRWYYFGARYYDPEVGRWLAPDPLAEKFPGWSPYNYTLNNPVANFDPDGREVRFAKSDSADAQTVVTQLNELHEGAGFYLKDAGDYYLLAISENSTFDFAQNEISAALFDVVNSSENVFTVEFLDKTEKPKGSPSFIETIEDVGGGYTSPKGLLSRSDAMISLQRGGDGTDNMGVILLHEALGHGHPIGSLYAFEGLTKGGVFVAAPNPYGAVNISWYYGSRRGEPRSFGGRHGGYNTGIKWKTQNLFILNGPYRQTLLK